MSTFPDAEELEPGATPDALEALVRQFSAPGAPASRSSGTSTFGYAGVIVLVCILSIVLAWPVAFSAGLTWHLAQSGWAVLG